MEGYFDSTEVVEKPHILDSGTRRQFETGAVRDIQEGKGRCDLLPLDVIAEIYCGTTDKFGPVDILRNIERFKNEGSVIYLRDALEGFMLHHIPFGDANWSTLYLEVAKHFEEGCKKYGENNWQKGIPTHCYIDSAVRHYLKWLRGDKDEPHDRAFCWNILCCIWTCLHKPELNDYKKVETEAEEKPVIMHDICGNCWWHDKPVDCPGVYNVDTRTCSKFKNKESLCDTAAGSNRCVGCGDAIPEGRQVCEMCDEIIDKFNKEKK